MSSEKFCLRWNDFERNISSAFKDIRDEKEFFDITIACEDEQLQAHKVILSACSPFFKKVLCRNHHQHPLLYLKGVSYKDMESVLNFMYHGEVNVAQDDLNSFLQVAEDLRVKGLTQNNGGNIGTEPKKPVDNIPKHEPSQSRVRNPGPALHSNRSHHTPPPAPPPRQHPHQEDDIQEIMPVVKSEPSHVVEAPIQPLVQQGMPMYDESAQQVGSNMMMSMETEQYGDGDTYGDYEGQYGDHDQGYDVGGGGQDGVGTDKVQCDICLKFYHSTSIRRHIRNQHGSVSQSKCDVCNMTFKNDGVKKDHMRRKHNVYQSTGY